jgi:hypothetical protein
MNDDWTGCIQAALVSSVTEKGATIYFPAGEYRLLGTIYTSCKDFSPNNDVILEGDGFAAGKGDSVAKNESIIVREDKGAILSINFNDDHSKSENERKVTVRKL